MMCVWMQVHIDDVCVWMQVHIDDVCVCVCVDAGSY